MDRPQCRRCRVKVPWLETIEGFPWLPATTGVLSPNLPCFGSNVPSVILFVLANRTIRLTRHFGARISLTPGQLPSLWPPKALLEDGTTGWVPNYATEPLRAILSPLPVVPASPPSSDISRTSGNPPNAAIRAILHHGPEGPGFRFVVSDKPEAGRRHYSLRDGSIWP